MTRASASVDAHTSILLFVLAVIGTQAYERCSSTCGGCSSSIAIRLGDQEFVLTVAYFTIQSCSAADRVRSVYQASDTGPWVFMCPVETHQLYGYWVTSSAFNCSGANPLSGVSRFSRCPYSSGLCLVYNPPPPPPPI
eukprot:6203961-Pleurochrysis_carterae.AAC.1